MINDKKDIPTYRLPEGGMSVIHRKYGLWICYAYTSVNPAKDSFRIKPLHRCDFYTLSHLYDGGGCVQIGDEKKILTPGDCVLVQPGTAYKRGSSDNHLYWEDAVYFCGPVADQLMESGVIKTGVFHAGPVRQLKNIVDLFPDPSADAQIQANIRLQKFLIDLYLDNKTRQRGYPIIKKVTELISDNPQKWWTVEEMASLCNLCRVQFRRVFTQYTGESPKIYLDRIKMRKASELLLNESNTIAQIAKHLGYMDPYHFSRRFKSVIGASPKHYRKSHIGREL